MAEGSRQRTAKCRGDNGRAEDPFERHCEGVVSAAKCSLDEVEIGIVVRDLFFSCLFDLDQRGRAIWRHWTYSC